MASHTHTHTRTKMNYMTMFHVTFFREVVAIYTAELRKVGFRILEFISQGLGVNPDHFRGELGENQRVLVNHYPPCPDPSLTLGLCKHRDPTVINILLQKDVYGLEVFKDEEWIGVEPIPYAFVVTLGVLMQVYISSQAITIYNTSVIPAL